MVLTGVVSLFIVGYVSFVFVFFIFIYWELNAVHFPENAVTVTVKQLD